MRASVRALRGAGLNRRKSCGIPAPASPFSQRRTRLSPMVIRSTAVLGAFVPYTLDRNNRQSDLPDRASLPWKRTRRAATEKETKGLRTIRTAAPLPSGQHSTCGPATAPSILVSALAQPNVSPKLLLNLQRDLMRDVKSGGFGPRPESPPFSCGIY